MSFLPLNMDRKRLNLWLLILWVILAVTLIYYASQVYMLKASLNEVSHNMVAVDVKYQKQLAVKNAELAKKETVIQDLQGKYGDLKKQSDAINRRLLVMQQLLGVAPTSVANK